MLWRRAPLPLCSMALRQQRRAVALLARTAPTHCPATQRPPSDTLVEASNAEPSAAGLECSSPFLDSLLNPPETIPLEDATRTYATMDVVPPCTVFDPRKPNVTANADYNDGEEEYAEPVVGPMRAAHAAGELWRHCASSTAEERTANKAPAWFEQLCRDLFFRTGEQADANQQQQHEQGSLSSSGAVDAGAGAAEDHVIVDRASKAEDVDPYLWLPFDLVDEAAYDVGPYVFPATAQYSHEQRVKMCLGNPRKEYVLFCSTYCFPERHQIPTSIGTVPARLYMDPSATAPVVYLQLSPNFPPCMWLPIKGTSAAVRRVVGAYAQMAAHHRDWHHAMYEERCRTVQRVMQLQNIPMENDGDMLRFMAYEARNAQHADAPFREFRNQQEFFLGEYDDPERVVEHMDLSPYLFAIPHMRVVTDPHAEHMTPTVEGPGMATSVFRCVHSKAIIIVNVMLSAEVKLPPQDPEAFNFMWKDSQVLPKMKIPVFARVVWPDNQRLCAGGILNRRFNQLFGTEFAADMPPDAAMTLYYTMNWCKTLNDFMGVHGMRQRVAELEAATRFPEPQRLYPGTREIPNPEYTTQERLGMHLQYLSQLGDPSVLETIRNILPSATAPVRMGCAKAALIAGDRQLFRQIVSSEPPGRMQHYMTKLVRKRKTRDLTDAEPRLLDDQYEFAAPLWTKKGTRIDRNTLEGAADAARLLR